MLVGGEHHITKNFGSFASFASQKLAQIGEALLQDSLISIMIRYASVSFGTRANFPFRKI
jgi:hypothetical protein